jgi:hypothetical protein
MTREEPLIPASFVRKIGYVILFVFTAYYIARGFRQETQVLFSMDFKTVYGGAECLLHHCDPYDSQQIYAAYLKAGGPPGQDMHAFRPNEPVYLPSALAMLTPFALLRWGPAHYLWLAFSVGVYVLGVWLIASLSFRRAPLTSAVGIGSLLLTNTLMIDLAQPAQLTVGLCAIAVWCIFEDRYKTLGTLCFAIALAFKPHLCGPVWLYFALCRGRYRQQAMQIFVVTVFVCLPGIIWASRMPASAHWFHEMQGNVTVLGMPGMTNDPSPANIEAPMIAELPALLSVIRNNPHFYNRLSWLIAGVFLVVWGVLVFRIQPSRERDYLAISSMVCISFFAVYHRNYDTCLLILIFPAFALLMSRGFWWQQATAAFTLFTIAEVANNHTATVDIYVYPYLKHPFSKWETIFWYRPVPFALSLLAVFSIVALYAWMRRERRGLPEEEWAFDQIY